MSELRVLDPKHGPEHAAHEMVIELVRAQTFEVKHSVAMNKAYGENLADAVIAAHKKLTEYYQTLAK
ncbi:hypothetical protein [Vreelandella titanicae]|uniref:hypothetical protein n=1 Tax=Vreelandella titanicae TaxID=664683 RepID=UPI00168175C0|nr:hypothetical protein [Halomonas titanicae]QNU62281.1 hypothetical protein HZS52_21475 [Halomonas titanicae]